MRASRWRALRSIIRALEAEISDPHQGDRTKSAVAVSHKHVGMTFRRASRDDLDRRVRAFCAPRVFKSAKSTGGSACLIAQD